MKRRAFKLLLFLLAGAIIDVAVAWGCALLGIGMTPLSAMSPDEAYRVRYLYYPAILPMYGWPLRAVGGNSALPSNTLWPGFAINTIFYAAVLWILFAVPGAVRRRVRRKRGQCAACGYSLRGTPGDTCPECGVRHSALTDATVSEKFAKGFR